MALNRGLQNILGHKKWGRAIFEISPLLLKVGAQPPKPLPAPPPLLYAPPYGTGALSNAAIRPSVCLSVPYPCSSQTVHFYARQHICYSAYMLWQFRLSVCLSVCLSVTRVDQPKTVKARITQFSPYSSPIPLVFRG